MLDPSSAFIYGLCRLLGRALRAGRYSSVRIIDHSGEIQVHKRRTFYAPLLVWLGDPLVRILGTGSRVLPQREWEQREERLYKALYNATVRVDDERTLHLPHLPGVTLASLLEDPALGAAARTRAIQLAVVALARLHARDITHGDAMAENVMVDLEAGVARWFDFETVHDPRRTVAWRRADDLRSLLATTLYRTASADIPETLDRILDGYGDEVAIRLLAPSFASVWQRPLPFHLGQAPLAFARFRTIGRLLRERIGE